MKAIKLNNELTTLGTKEVDILTLFCNQYPSLETRRAYRRDIEGFCKFLDETRTHPLNVKPMIISAYLTSLRENKTVNTINRALGTLKALYRWLVANQYLTVNPADSVKALKGSVEKPTQAFTDQEAKAMIESPNVDTLDGNCDRLVLVFLFYLGLRRNEVGRIRIRDVSLERDQWTLIVIGKGNKRRAIPISPVVFQEIGAYRARYEFSTGRSLKKTSLLFQREKFINTTPIHDTTVYRAVQKYSEQLGIDRKVGPHSCRATVISHMLEKGVSIRDVADFAGHTSIATTQIYDKARDLGNTRATSAVDFDLNSEVTIKKQQAS